MIYEKFVNENIVNNTLFEEKIVVEIYSVDGVFSIKVELDTSNGSLVNNTLKEDSYKSINNGDIIKVFKKYENGKK